MRVSTLLPALLSTVGLTSAAANGQPPVWDVTNFRPQCIEGACPYSFNITGHHADNTPSFKTSCTGESQTKLAKCDNSTVHSSVIALGDSKWHVQVRFVWFKPIPDGRGNLTLSTQGKQAERNVSKADFPHFTLNPDSGVGVAR
ncbi:hypothetical protein NUU61_010194 [Penicillium alfredii]|uniref:Uncharacterized protein n=1 Tax=Penicillium alfredii TaxID=1506179 RepID=A0A9W9JUG1_9EURO|nr:uncharacterized protein NUU61_010194 [Penicillium alfredii]KAJ5081930.1 hypothetical protein NUU61_010194 [Penicillium alfredii]